MTALPFDVIAKNENEICCQQQLVKQTKNTFRRTRVNREHAMMDITEKEFQSQ
jgi:hypothetical protein